ncbi:hypothetical protein GCM10009792_22340 [Microcella alkalica]|uniref:Uncharacterized protein n=1 Tax=Microcella alkalica TaxID=355930 RepID=A0A839E6R4_9MICO|nr:hypothetical protein [Microcella alkalica]MBA8848151.1 hypothetical protein [Microcella alkalica]
MNNTHGHGRTPRLRLRAQDENYKLTACPPADSGEPQKKAVTVRHDHPRCAQLLAYIRDAAQGEVIGQCHVELLGGTVDMNGPFG